MTEPPNTHHWVMPHGRFRGRPITRIPVSYLKWMVNVRHDHAEYAKAELERRGTVTPNLEISGHAIDRASLLCWKIWRADREPDEGLHAWLVRVAREALEIKAPAAETERRRHKGMRFEFELDCEWPVLKTVVRLKVPSKKGGGRRAA